MIYPPVGPIRPFKMVCAKRSAYIAIGAAALALTCGTHAAGLFQLTGAADVAASQGSASVVADAREHRVRVARQYLSAARAEIENTGEGRLLLNVAEGAHLDVIVERTAPTKFGYSLSGRVAGGAGGFVTLVVHEEAVAGSIWTPDSAYELYYLGSGVHALQDVTRRPIECGGTLPSELSAAAQIDQGSNDNGSVVDILVVWTPEAEEEYGGSRPQVLSRIDLMIAHANDAFERSGAFVSLNLVGAEKVDYVENESSSDLRRLGSPDDGHMDSVHEQRDALGADLVYLLTRRSGGRAFRPGAFSLGDSTSFAHEVGHNMGLGHDRLASASHLFFSTGFTTEHCFSTIMSYGSNCYRHRRPVLPFYASPWAYDPARGVPLGVTRFAKDRGARGPADAVLALNRNRHGVANYRPSGSAGLSDDNGSWVDAQPASVRTRSSAELTLPTASVSENVDSETSETPVDIPDPVLRQAVEEQLSKVGGPVTRGEMATLTSLVVQGSPLRLHGNGVRELTGIEYALNLSSLYVRRHAISDLAPLAELTSLTSLSLPRGQIVDVAPLAGLTSLEDLELFRNGVSDVTPLEKLTSLEGLSLAFNQISDLAPLVANKGLGHGDYVRLDANPLSRSSLEMHVPALLDRGAIVQHDVLPEILEIGDIRLREAVYDAIQANNGEDLSTLLAMDGRGQSIKDLTGLEGASSLEVLFLDKNKITDIAPLAELNLRALTLAYNMVDDWGPLVSMDSLAHVSLDGNSLRELPLLPTILGELSFADNSISDIGSLDASPQVLRVSGNSITSLEPLRQHWRRLLHLEMHDNQITDISPLNFRYLREIHMRNNAVRDISPLLNGEELLMADVRRNPLADDALTVLETLRQRRVTVLAGETVPHFPAAGQPREGFVRIVNRSNEDGHAFIEAVDDAGVRFGLVRLDVGARRAVHFDSADLEDGNASKGLDGIGAPTTGDWRLSVISALDVEVLSYIRTEDGFLTAMHDVLPDAMAPFFNPASNERQRSFLRVVNTEAEPAKWTTGGYDDGGKWHPMAGSLLVRPQHALTLTASALENEHGLGDGRGKWRLRVRGFPWFAMSLLENPTGHLTNLSTAPAHTTPLPDGTTLHRLPLFPAAGGLRKGFARVINRSYASGEVAIHAVDDDGTRFGPVQLAMRPRQAVYFDSRDLEGGNAAKGLLGGVGVGEGDWRLDLTSELDLMVLAYARTADGFLTAMHDLAPVAEDGSHRVVFFNPGSNTEQVSKLRLINDGERRARVTITGIDDAGSGSGTATLTVSAGLALAFTSAELETGSGRVAGGLGDGEGRWRLRVRSNEPIAVMSLLETPSGLLANMSTGTAE